MEDLHSAGKVPYVKATNFKEPSASELFILYCGIVKDVIYIIFLYIKFLILNINKIFENKKKIINGQLALVTGGGNGLGREISIKLAVEGCNVVIVDVDRKGGSETAKELIENYGIKSKYYFSDVSKSEIIKETIEQIHNEMGSIDILVNNAGLMPLISIRDGSDDDIKKLFDVNVLGHFWMIRSIIDGMITRKKGHIVAISSLSALHPMPGTVPYSSTKFAVAGLMHAFREELRQEGLEQFIRTTTVYPYFIPTRKDLVETVNIRFPGISAEDVAVYVLNGILYNKRNVIVPGHFFYLVKLVNIFPDSMIDLIRDYVLKEKEAKRMFIKKI